MSYRAPRSRLNRIDQSSSSHRKCGRLFNVVRHARTRSVPVHRCNHACSTTRYHRSTARIAPWASFRGISERFRSPLMSSHTDSPTPAEKRGITHRVTKGDLSTAHDLQRKNRALHATCASWMRTRFPIIISISRAAYLPACMHPHGTHRCPIPETAIPPLAGPVVAVPTVSSQHVEFTAARTVARGQAAQWRTGGARLPFLSDLS